MDPLQIFRIAQSGRLTSGQSILKDLLESQKLQDAQVYGWVKAQATLVGPESTVELHAVAAVDLDLALVVLPYDTELDHALGDSSNGKSFLVLGVLFKQAGVFEGRGEFCHNALATEE